MFYALIKAAISGLLILAISETAKRSPVLGALVASLPLVSILAVIWLWNDTGDNIRIADQMQATFWYILPSLPLFLVMPALLRVGMGFWPALALAMLLTMILYLLMAAALARYGVRL
ncbi:MAG: DUF3147 family protein [Parvibaculum sp.]|jgi:hypothetical protein